MPNKTAFPQQLHSPMHPNQSGFNLVEVLIALVVLAVGLLGLAALQNMGLRLGHESYERTQATLLIDEIIDRMRANPSGVEAGNYATTLTSIPPTFTTDCGTVTCNAGEMAKYDMNQWISTITGAAGAQSLAIAGGEGAIEPIAGSTTLFDISVKWQEQSVAMKQTVRVHLP